MADEVYYEVVGRPPRKKGGHGPPALVDTFPERQWVRALKLAHRLVRDGFLGVVLQEVVVTDRMALRPREKARP